MGEEVVDMGSVTPVILLFRVAEWLFPDIFKVPHLLSLSESEGDHPGWAGPNTVSA